MKIYFSGILIVLFLAGCVATAPRAIMRFNHKLNQAEIHQVVEEFLGKTFPGTNVTAQERALEKFYTGWSRSALLNYLSERRRSSKIPNEYSNSDSEIVVSFYFVGQRDGKYDTNRKRIIFSIAENSVSRVAVLDTDVFGLSADEI